MISVLRSPASFAILDVAAFMAVCVVQLAASRVSLRVVLVLFLRFACGVAVGVRVLGGLFLEAATLGAADHDHFSTVFDYFF